VQLPTTIDSYLRAFSNELGQRILESCPPLHGPQDPPSPLMVQYAPLQTGRTLDGEHFLTLKRDCPNFTHVKVDLVPPSRLIARLRESSQRAPTNSGRIHGVAIAPRCWVAGGRLHA